MPWAEGMSEQDLRLLLAQLEEHEQIIREQEQQRAHRRIETLAGPIVHSSDFRGCLE